MSVFRRPRPSSACLRRHSRPLSVSAGFRTAPRRTQDFNSGFSSSYDPTEDTGRGPMFSRAKFGVPQFYPRDLKKRIDAYVVGQERAKKTVCSVVFNHYQRLRRRYHQDDSDRILREKLQRQSFARERDLHERRNDTHPVEGPPQTDTVSWRYADDRYREDEYPGHHEAVHGPSRARASPADKFYIAEDAGLQQHVRIDKSNLLLVGPTGVGKTYILETLSKKINVPFTICDCNSFTQAGYIGQDVETCIERLLIESNYDVKATEHGIIVLDEFDKIAKREAVNGRDVGGEGVQQALLKLVEGTKVTINVKDNRSSRSASPTANGYGPANTSSAQQTSSPAGRMEQYTIDTTNILFVFCGAFVGLDKHVLKRVAKPSMGFGSEIRSSSGSSISGSKAALPAEMYAHLPHQPAFPDPDTALFTPLDLADSSDLQSFGFIPELIGRIHNISALTPLSLQELYRILNEPRNSLVAQYTSLFETYPSRLAFTQRALHGIAERAAKNETGARGLKMEMERVLAEPMFDAPMPYVLITEGCVKGTEKAEYWGKDGLFELERRMREEDSAHPHVVDGAATSFEQLRQAGQSGA